MTGARSARNLKRTVAVVAAALAGALAMPVAASAALSVHGSVKQVYVTGANTGEQLRLFDGDGKRVATKPVGSLGGVLFRRVDAGKGYRVRSADGTLSGRVNVMSAKNAPNSTAVYNQTLPAGGYGYLTTRDGTQLAASVRGAQPGAGHPPSPAGATE